MRWSLKPGYTKQFYNTLVTNLSAKWDLSYVTPGLSARGLVAFDVVDITENTAEDAGHLFLCKRPGNGC